MCSWRPETPSGDELPLLGTLNAFSPGMRVAPTSVVRAAVLLAPTLLVGACSSAPKLDKQLETLSSWTATMRLAREEHGSGAITTTVAVQLRDGAVTALRQTQQTIGQAAHSGVDSSYVAAGLDSLRTAIRRLEAELGS
jgi:hypothetical protein